MRLAPAMPLIIFVFLIIFLGIGLFTHKDELPSALINTPLPEFSLPALKSNTPFTPDDFKGHYSLLNIFASWCVSCHVEHPTLLRFSKTEKLPIYAISWKDKPEDTKRWLQEFSNPYTKIGVDIKGRVIIDLGVTGAPETFLINPEGLIIYKHLGPLTQDVLEDIIFPLTQKEANAS